jgi:hypothetical protein
MATTSTPTLTATATSRTSGEAMDPTAVLLAGPRRARDASGLLQLVEERGRARLRDGEQCSDERHSSSRGLPDVRGRSYSRRTSAAARAIVKRLGRCRGGTSQ